MARPVRAGCCPARSNPRGLDVAAIVRAHGATVRRQQALSREQRQALRAIAVCRTPALGGHVDVCSGCGFERPAYHSCRNRHCPKCQNLAQARWIDPFGGRQVDHQRGRPAGQRRAGTGRARLEQIGAKHDPLSAAHLPVHGSHLRGQPAAACTDAGMGPA